MAQEQQHGQAEQQHSPCTAGSLPLLYKQQTSSTQGESSSAPQPKHPQHDKEEFIAGSSQHSPVPASGVLLHSTPPPATRASPTTQTQHLYTPHQPHLTGTALLLHAGTQAFLCISSLSKDDLPGHSHPRRRRKVKVPGLNAALPRGTP